MFRTSFWLVSEQRKQEEGRAKKRVAFSCWDAAKPKPFFPPVFCRVYLVIRPFLQLTLTPEQVSDSTRPVAFQRWNEYIWLKFCLSFLQEVERCTLEKCDHKDGKTQF